MIFKSLNSNHKKTDLLFAIFFSVTLHAADFQVGEISYKIVSLQDMTCVVTTPGVIGTHKNGSLIINDDIYTHIIPPKSNLYSGHIVIPQNPEFKGRLFTVIGIDECAFFNCFNLISISIPPSVKTIGEMAFYGCEKLENVYGNICASIDFAAFYGCISLKSINLIDCPNISNLAFKKCSNLSVISIPETTLQIGEEAFAECGQLSMVELKDNSTTIALYMDVFKGSPIDNLYIGRNLSYYSGSTSRKPFEQIRHLTIGDNVSSLNEGIKLYNVFGFGFDEFLMEINETYRYIFDLTDLETIVIGLSLSKVPAFKKAQPESITFHSSTPPDVDGSFSNYNILRTILYVPKGAIDNYKNVEQWEYFIIKEK